MSSQLAVVPGAAVVVSAEWLNQLDLVKRTVAPGLTDEEFALFCHIARVRHLDPLQRQIHAVKRKTWNAQANGGKGAYEDKMTIQTAIDGYRSIANRTGLYMPSDKGALLEGSGDVSMRITMWVKKYHPISASWHEFSATAYYREFVQTRKDENKKVIPNSMWEKMPVNQLTKCAEALALRKGWPEELGGIYVDEEMQHADSPTVLPPTQTQSQQDRTKKEMGTMKTSAEPNRGHGNEGTMRTEAAICAECRQQNGQHTDDCKLNPKNRTKGKAGKDTGAPKKNPREQWDTAEGHDLRSTSRSLISSNFATPKRTSSSVMRSWRSSWTASSTSALAGSSSRPISRRFWMRSRPSTRPHKRSLSHLVRNLAWSHRRGLDKV